MRLGKGQTHRPWDREQAPPRPTQTRLVFDRDTNNPLKEMQQMVLVQQARKKENNLNLNLTPDRKINSKGSQTSM